MTPTIRAATLADVPRLVALGRAQLAATYGDALADNPAQGEALMTSVVSLPTAAGFVAEVDGAVVGMILLVRYPHPMSGQITVGEIAWGVDPAARGAGLALLRRAERWARAQGAERLQLAAPASQPRTRLLYERLGYRAVETTYQRALAPSVEGLRVHDDVLPDIDAYRATVLAGPFEDVEPRPGLVFHGINRAVDGQLPLWIATEYPALRPTLTFARQSPAGQVEPHDRHTDVDMGEWTGILYLTADPPPDDGTTFWRQDGDEWRAWHTVAARPNRLVLFPASYVHARAIPENYGEGDTARLIQVVFGTGRL